MSMFLVTKVWLASWAMASNCPGELPESWDIEASEQVVEGEKRLIEVFTKGFDADCE